jgi:hypothetical protein
MVREGFRFKPACRQTGFNGERAQLEMNSIFRMGYLANQTLQKCF